MGEESPDTNEHRAPGNRGDLAGVSCQGQTVQQKTDFLLKWRMAGKPSFAEASEGKGEKVG